MRGERCLVGWPDPGNEGGHGFPTTIKNPQPYGMPPAKFSSWAASDISAAENLKVKSRRHRTSSNSGVGISWDDRLPNSCRSGNGYKTENSVIETASEIAFEKQSPPCLPIHAVQISKSFDLSIGLLA